MNKALIACCAFVAALVARADMDNLRITFQTKGVDTYQDGTTVRDGEFYALVWVASGASFAGFNADATLKDPVANELVVSVPFAKDGRLGFTKHEIPASAAGKYADGSFLVVLLDTRNADGTLSGSVTDAEGVHVPNAVNGYSTVADVSAHAAAYSTSLNLGLPVSVSSVSGIPADAPKPVITGIRLRDGAKGREAVLTVKGTAPYLRYVAAGGDEPKVGDKLPETAVNGAADAEREIEIVVPAENASAFYSVERQ